MALNPLGGEVMTAIPGWPSDGIGTCPNAGGGVVLTSTGQIVALSNDNVTGQFALARYNANGTLDTTFGQGGYVITSVSGTEGGEFAGLLQQPDGTLIVT